MKKLSKLFALVGFAFIAIYISSSNNAEAQTLSCVQSTSSCTVETLKCVNGSCWTDDFQFNKMEPYEDIPNQ